MKGKAIAWRMMEFADELLDETKEPKQIGSEMRELATEELLLRGVTQEEIDFRIHK